MKKKILAIILLASLALIAFSACAQENYDFVNKTYIYEKFGMGGAFTIMINEDGTFSYNEGAESEYTANGIWTYKNGIITLDDNLGEELKIVNQFSVVDGGLIFIEEGSTNFIGVKVANGERFIDTSK